MVFHELATNAAKYGALSKGGGRLEVRWRVAKKSTTLQLIIEWREIGGPQVNKPERRGYGSALIEEIVARSLGGKAELKFEKSGLQAAFMLPIGCEGTEKPSNFDWGEG